MVRPAAVILCGFVLLPGHAHGKGTPACTATQTRPVVLALVDAASDDLAQSEQAVFEDMFGETSKVRRGYPFSQAVYRRVRRKLLATATTRHLGQRNITGIARTDYDAAMRCWPKLAAALRGIDRIGNDRASIPPRSPSSTPQAAGEARRDGLFGLPAAYVGYWVPSEATCQDEAIHRDSSLQVRLRRIVRHESVCEIETVTAKGTGHAVQAVCEEAGNPPERVTIRLTMADGILVETMGKSTNAYRRCSTDPDWQPPMRSDASGPASTMKR